jgi:hypothetical protein
MNLLPTVRTFVNPLHNLIDSLSLSIALNLSLSWYVY